MTSPDSVSAELIPGWIDKCFDNLAQRQEAEDHSALLEEITNQKEICRKDVKALIGDIKLKRNDLQKDNKDLSEKLDKMGEDLHKQEGIVSEMDEKNRRAVEIIDALRERNKHLEILLFEEKLAHTVLKKIARRFERNIAELEKRQAPSIVDCPLCTTPHDDTLSPVVAVFGHSICQTCRSRLELHKNCREVLSRFDSANSDEASNPGVEDPEDEAMSQEMRAITRIKKWQISPSPL